MDAEDLIEVIENLIRDRVSMMVNQFEGEFAVRSLAPSDEDYQNLRSAIKSDPMIQRCLKEIENLRPLILPIKIRIPHGSVIL